VLNTTTLENLSFIKVMLDEKINDFTEAESVTKTLENAKEARKLKTGYLRENASKTFTFRLWLDEDTPARQEFMNKLLESKITITTTYKSDLNNTINIVAVSNNEIYSDTETYSEYKR